MSHIRPGVCSPTRGAGIVGEGKSCALRSLLALAVAAPLLGGPVAASDEFNPRVLVSCSAEAEDNSSSSAPSAGAATARSAA